jgi:DNA modification methylase
MVQLVKENGLNSNLIKSQMERQIFKNGRKLVYDNVTLYNNDCVVAMDDIADNSVQMVLTSIPFGDHYEYSDNYNDFGHNHGNENFFKQMDFLTPKLLRALEHGRIAAIHVKDRIRYSYQNGTMFTKIADFSGQTVAHFEKHGFHLIGKITVTTDVVAENNQTYRLGWTEQCKDATKMGVGLPEYVLLFRKAPSHLENAYADTPVTKEKTDYTKALWQLDAHSYQRSSGDRFLTKDELQKMEVKRIVAAWKKHNTSEIYDFKEHLRICEDLDEAEKLSSTFMTLPVHSNRDYVWSDINRMNTLNANQVNSKKEKHICPLQFDIIERLINRYTMKGEIVLDPFGGLCSTAYKALELNRKAISIELNPEYFNDGLFYMKALMNKLTVPTLFDFA